MFKYKGYYSVPQYSKGDGVYWGKIEGIHDLVTFESDFECDLELEFQRAVDSYLEFKNDIVAE